MTNKKNIIMKVFKNSNTNNYNKIMIFTKEFQVFGEIDDNSYLEELLTLKNATVIYLKNDLQTDDNINITKLDWLNLFCSDIIAFSFVE